MQANGEKRYFYFDKVVILGEIAFEERYSQLMT